MGYATLHPSYAGFLRNLHRTFPFDAMPFGCFALRWLLTLPISRAD